MKKALAEAISCLENERDSCQKQVVHLTDRKELGRAKQIGGRIESIDELLYEAIMRMIRYQDAIPVEYMVKGSVAQLRVNIEGDILELPSTIEFIRELERVSEITHVDPLRVDGRRSKCKQTNLKYEEAKQMLKNYLKRRS